VYEADDGSFYVQGYIVSNEVRDSVKLPSGEELVRIDASLLKALKG
jgi:hypothetical protein